MTCQQARSIMDGSIGHGGPAAVTRDERNAVMAHIASCSACDRYVEERASEAEAVYGPLSEGDYAKIRKLYADDQFDSEITTSDPRMLKRHYIALHGLKAAEPPEPTA